MEQRRDGKRKGGWDGIHDSEGGGGTEGEGEKRGRKERGCDTRPLGRDERVLRVSGVFNAGRVLRFPAVVEAPDASKRGDSISGRAS